MRLKRCGVYKIERVTACSVHPSGDGGLDVRLTLEVRSACCGAAKSTGSSLHYEGGSGGRALWPRLFAGVC